MNHEKWAIVSDFDGTITNYDVGDKICIKFCAVSQAELDESLNPDNSIENWMTKTFNKMKESQPEVEDFILKDVEHLDHFPDFFSKAQKSGMPFVITSGGLSVYIKPLLKKWNINPTAAYFGKMNKTPKGWLCDYSYLGSMKLDDFKAKAVTDLQEKGYKVAFFGDGPSDVLALKKSDAAFAKDAAYKMLMANPEQAARENKTLFKLTSYRVAADFFKHIFKDN